MPALPPLEFPRCDNPSLHQKGWPLAGTAAGVFGGYRWFAVVGVGVPL